MEIWHVSAHFLHKLPKERGKEGTMAHYAPKTYYKQHADGRETLLAPVYNALPCEHLTETTARGWWEYLSLTPIEARIVRAFVCSTVLSDEQLSRLIYDRPYDQRMIKLLEKHVDHIRPKVRSYSYDVGRILRYGYILLPVILSDGRRLT